MALVDGLACASGVWVVVWVSCVDRAGISLAQAWGVGWHRCRAGSAAGMDWVWLVYALGCLLTARAGLSDAYGAGLWDRRRRSTGVLLLVVKCWRAVLGVDSEILSFSSGGKPE